MTFALLKQRLIDLANGHVQNGDVTESQLARLTGVSQPHIHNVLKGARILSSELADEIIRQLRINPTDLFSVPGNRPELSRAVPLLEGLLGPGMFEFNPHRHRGTLSVPAALADRAHLPLAARLSCDVQCAPRFQPADTILIDQSEPGRLQTAHGEVYVVLTAAGPRLRSVRRGGSRLYFAPECSLNHPLRWESVALSGPLLQIVRGRVIWISRNLAGAR